jgi:hypothetical protein
MTSQNQRQRHVDGCAKSDSPKESCVTHKGDPPLHALPANPIGPHWRMKNVSIAALALYFATRLVGRNSACAGRVLNGVVRAVLEDSSTS